MKKEQIKNCWEYLQCGREPGGSHVDELGICPATIVNRFNGVNGGENAGRFCWFVSGTLCEGRTQGSFAKKLRDCLECSFYLQVEKEEGRHLVLTEDDIEL